MPRIPKFSQNVARQILKERGLEGQVTEKQLAEAAQGHDLRSKGYASRDELELAASDLSKTLGLDPGMEKKDGLRFDREVLDGAKLALRQKGVLVDDDQLVSVLMGIDEGYGRASKAEVGRAVTAIGEAAALERLEKAGDDDLPARAAIAAEAEGAVPDLARRKLTDDFQYAGSGPVKVAFFDADSTLRVSRSGKVSANSPDDVAILPFAADKLKELEDDGYLVVIVSNQAGVQYGHVSIDDADAALALTSDRLRALGGNIHYIDYAEKNGPDRKPNTGMFDRLEAMLVDTFGPEATIDKSSSMMVGDSSYKRGVDTRPDGEPGTRFSNSDRKFAENAGVPFLEPGEIFGWNDYGVRDFDNIGERSAFLDPFTTGKRVHRGPLLARLAALDE